MAAFVNSPIVGFASTGTMVALAKTDGTFEGSKLSTADFGSNAGWTSQTNNPRLLGEVNGDGRADIVAFAGAGVSVALAKADGTFQGGQLALSAFGQSQGWGSQDATPRQLIDVNNDGILDIVSGAWWYQGPDFKKKHSVGEVQAYGEYYDDFSTIAWKVIAVDTRQRLVPSAEVLAHDLAQHS